MSAGLLLAAGGGIEKEIITQAGGAAGLVAIIGMALVIPLYVTQRREVKRLEHWRELEPERGDEGAPQAQPAYAAAAPGYAPRPAAYTTGTRLTPAERVTADRPALERITAERAAIQSPSFWRRLIARGPRHPVILALIAILFAGAAVGAVALFTDTLGDPSKVDKAGRGTKAAGLDRASVEVTVLNASATPALADKVADDLAERGFSSIETALTDESGQSVVLFADGFQKEARAVAKEIEVDVLQPISREVEAAAPDAEVVVIAGEDRARD